MARISTYEAYLSRSLAGWAAGSVVIEYTNEENLKKDQGPLCLKFMELRKNHKNEVYYHKDVNNAIVYYDDIRRIAHLLEQYVSIKNAIGLRYHVIFSCEKNTDTNRIELDCTECKCQLRMTGCGNISSQEVVCSEVHEPNKWLKYIKTALAIYNGPINPPPPPPPPPRTTPPRYANY